MAGGRVFDLALYYHKPAEKPGGPRVDSVWGHSTAATEGRRNFFQRAAMPRWHGSRMPESQDSRSRGVATLSWGGHAPTQNKPTTAISRRLRVPRPSRCQNRGTVPFRRPFHARVLPMLPSDGWGTDLPTALPSPTLRPRGRRMGHPAQESSFAGEGSRGRMTSP